MLSIALLHIIISLICLFAGMLLHILFKNSRNEAIVVYFISGLIAITCMGQIAALFTAVGPFLQLTIASLLLLAAFLKRNALVAILKRLKNESLPASRMELISFLSLWVLLIVYASGPTQMDDTESYHIQMVKWLKEYGTVPGLANLHERFGFNSSWFTSIALFAPTSRQVNYYVILNSLISVWFVFYLLRIIFKTNSGRPSLQIAATCILGIALISFPILRGNAATANYDSITCLLILVLFGETWQKGDSFHNWQPGPEWLLWPAYLFTIRVTNMPFTLLLVPALYILLKRSNRRQIGFLIFFYLLLWVPFLVRNVILSGYIFYPLTIPDLFHPDWKSDPAIAEKVMRFIKNYNRVHEFPIAVTEQLNFSQWVKEWFRQLYNWDKWVVYPGLAGCIIVAYSLIRKKIKGPPALLAMAALLQLLLWAFTAPDPRFIYGPLLVAAACVPICLFNWLQFGEYRRNVIICSWLCLLFSISLAAFKMYSSSRSISLLKVGALPQPNVQTIPFRYYSIYLPKRFGDNWNPRCYASELPCAYRIDPRLEPRGKSPAKGFRVNYAIIDSLQNKDLIYLEN